MSEIIGTPDDSNGEKKVEGEEGTTDSGIAPEEGGKNFTLSPEESKMLGMADPDPRRLTIPLRG